MCMYESQDQMRDLNHNTIRPFTVHPVMYSNTLETLCIESMQVDWPRTIRNPTMVATIYSNSTSSMMYVCIQLYDIPLWIYTLPLSGAPPLQIDTVRGFRALKHGPGWGGVG